MGADMYLSICGDPANLGFTSGEIAERIRQICSMASESMIDEFFNNFSMDCGLQAAYEVHLEECADKNPLQELVDQAGEKPSVAWGRREMARRIEEAYQEVLDSREVAGYTIGGTDYLLTGGVTWGDDPTEQCANMSMLDWINLYPTPQRRKTWELNFEEHCPYATASEFPVQGDLYKVVQVGEHDILLIVAQPQRDNDGVLERRTPLNDRGLPENFRVLLWRAGIDRVRMIRWCPDGSKVDYLPKGKMDR